VITIIKDRILKCEHNIHCTNIPTKLSMYCVADYNVQKNPPRTLTISLTKTIQSSHPTSFKRSHYIILPCGSSCSSFQSKLCISSFFTTCMLHGIHMYYVPCYIYVSICWTVTHMKLITHSSAPLYSYLPLTQIFPSPPCSHKPQISVLLFMQHTKQHTHTKWHEQCQFYRLVHATFWT
jgi:hypothetical protein